MLGYTIIYLKILKVGVFMQLKGKTILFLGSSVTCGAEHISFIDVMAQRCGINAVKEAVSGTHLADITEQSYVARLKKVDKELKPDLFICQLSTNDTHPDIPLSKTEDAIRFILEYVKNTFGCPMAFYTGVYFENEKYAKMVDMLYKLQKEYDFSILDLFNDKDMSSVSAEDHAKYMTDSIHPTVLGYEEWLTPKFIEFCDELLFNA